MVTCDRIMNDVESGEYESYNYTEFKTNQFKTYYLCALSLTKINQLSCFVESRQLFSV